MGSDRVRATLLGGALGAALGGLVEFDSIERIRLQYGRAGIVDPPTGQPLLITDDTQMTPAGTGLGRAVSGTLNPIRDDRLRGFSD